MPGPAARACLPLLLLLASARAWGAAAHSEHKLFLVESAAVRHGIPAKIIEWVIARPEVKVEFHDYEGEKSAGYIPDKDTMRLATAAKDASGRYADPYRVKPASSLMQDAFHEAFHAKWDLENFWGRKVYWAVDAAARAKAQYQSEHGLALSDEQAFEVVEEAVGVKFGLLVGTAFDLSERAVKRAKNGHGDPDQPAETPQQRLDAAMGYLERNLARALAAEWTNPGAAYCNEKPCDEKKIMFDLGDDGRRFIETALLGATMPELIARVKARTSVLAGVEAGLDRERLERLSREAGAAVGRAAAAPPR